MLCFTELLLFESEMLVLLVVVFLTLLSEPSLTTVFCFPPISLRLPLISMSTLAPDMLRGIIDSEFDERMKVQGIIAAFTYQEACYISVNQAGVSQ
jgi:hypothetical protein